MGTANAGKCSNMAILNRYRCITVGFEYRDLILWNVKFKGRLMLQLVPYDCEFQVSIGGEASVSGYARRVLRPDKQPIKQGPDRSGPSPRHSGPDS